jgi:periplasmic protein TonB
LNSIKPNSKYGAFELKEIYRKNFIVGISSAAIIHLLIIIVAFIISPKEDEENTITVRMKIIPYNEIGPPPSIIEKETPAKNIVAEKPTFGNPVAAKKGEKVSEFEVPKESSSSVSGEVKVEEPKAEPKKEEKKVEEPYLVSVDMMPEPFGGMKEIQRLLIYPKAAKNEQIEGKVFVKAFINAQGSVTRTEIVKGLGYGCDEEAIRIIRMTSFRPGKQSGRYVNVQMTISILFSLSN